MIEQLFGSKTRVKLLQLFYSNPNRSFYVREITRKIEEQINSVRRELSNLLSIGIITSDNTNNKLYYEVNQKYEYFVPLQQIFGKNSSSKAAAKPGATDSGVSQSNDLKQIGHIDLAVLSGQFTRDNSAGVDVLIVGDINKNALQKYIEELEKRENKTLKYTSMSLNDFKYRQQIRDRFALGIIKAKKQVLIDEYGLLTEKSNKEQETEGEEQS